MTTIREKSMAFEPKVTKNIADLEKFNVNLDIKSKTVSEGTTDEFSYDFVEIDGVEHPFFGIVPPNCGFDSSISDCINWFVV